jgi:DNA-binding NarL/FixJ family response regulator
MSTVIVADAESPSRLALCAELRRIGHQVVADVQDGYEALHKTIELVPDLLILPLRLRRLSGIEVIHQLRRRRVRTRVLVLSVVEDPHFVAVAMRTGASGFVSKREDMAQLLAAVEAVAHGHTFFTDREGKSLANDAWRRTEIEQIESLSPRELTVFGYLAAGYSNAAIAHELGLSDRSISTFKARLFRKLNIKSLVELAGMAERLNFFGPTIDSGVGPSGEGAAPTLEGTLDAMPYSIAIRDLQGRLLFANEYYTQHYGMRLQNALGTRFADLEQLDVGTIDELNTLFTEALRSDCLVNRELMVSRASGPTAQAVWMAPIHDVHGKIQAVACGASRLDEFEATFVALRHERERLRTENVVRANLVREYAQSVKLELDTLARRLQEHAGADSPSPETCALAAGVSQSYEALSMQWEALDEGLKLDVSSSQTAPELCDPVAAIRQVIEAIATDRRVRIAFTQTEGAAGPRRVWVQVRSLRELVRRVALYALDTLSWTSLDVTVSARAASRGLVALRLGVAGGGSGGGSLPPSDFDYPQLVKSLAKSLGATLAVRRDSRAGVLQVELMLTRGEA